MTTAVVESTTISEAELSALDTDGSASRWVITADNFGNISSSLLGQIDLNLEGLTGYTDGGMLFDYNGDYYNASDVTFNGIYVTVNSGAESVTLADGACYTTLKIAATSSASVKGLGFVVTAPSVPEPTTATLSLLALAGLAARRRRK